MKKFFKTMFIVAGTAFAGYLGLKLYKKVSNITKLQKSLPEFLNNVYGEKPVMHINHNLKTMTIKIGFTQEIIDKYSDIETTVREYIDDFYPELTKGPIVVDIYSKLDETEDTESCCTSTNKNVVEED